MEYKSDCMRIFFLFLCSIALFGCISGEPSETTLLLQQDYLKMTNTQLVDYEQKLSDELVNSLRSGSSNVGVGFGFGSWGGNSGYGIRTDQWLGGSGEDSTTRELRSRRDDVRNEMRRRGLLPE